MKILYEPEGGRFGEGFDYYCGICNDYLGNSSNDQVLEHPLAGKIKVRTGLFRNRYEQDPNPCPECGKKYAMPVHEIDVQELH